MSRVLAINSLFSLASVVCGNENLESLSLVTTLSNGSFITTVISQSCFCNSAIKLANHSVNFTDDTLDKGL